MINLMQLASMVKNGGNPMVMLQQMAQSDPRAQSAMQFIAGKTPQQLQEIATNMARERGTTPQEIARKLGIM